MSKLVKACSQIACMCTVNIKPICVLPETSWYHKTHCCCPRRLLLEHRLASCCISNDSSGHMACIRGRGFGPWIISQCQRQLKILTWQRDATTRLCLCGAAACVFDGCAVSLISCRPQRLRCRGCMQSENAHAWTTLQPHILVVCYYASTRHRAFEQLQNKARPKRVLSCP